MGERDFSRIDRVADQIQRHLAEIINTEVADERVPRLTVSGVKVSKDLRSARVFVTPPAGSDPEAAVQAVNRAAGFLRSRLGDKLRLKYLPRLKFEYDATLDEADRLVALLNEASGNHRTDD